MFQHSYQSGGYLEVFHTKTDKEKDKAYEKLYKVANAGGIKKVYDKVTKGYIYEVDGARTSLHFPSNEKQDLGLIQPFLVLQVFLPQGSPFSVEITITDTLKNKRRFHFSTAIRQIEKNYFHAKIPLDVVKRGVWMNLSFDLISFFELFKGQTFRSIDAFTVGAVCKIRRIFTMRGPIMDFSFEDELTSPQNDAKMVPKTQNFPPGVTYANQLITLDLIKSHTGFNPEESTHLEESTSGVSSLALKSKGNSVPAKQPLAASNVAKKENQPFKSPVMKNKVPLGTQKEKGVIKPQLEQTETAKGKENVRENTTGYSGEKEKGLGSLMRKKPVVAPAKKVQNDVNPDFDDEKVRRSVPKAYKFEEKEIMRLSENPLEQESMGRSSPEFAQPVEIATNRDYEEQKTGLGKGREMVSSVKKSTGKKAKGGNPWVQVGCAEVRSGQKGGNKRENIVSASTVDTRKEIDTKIQEDKVYDSYEREEMENKEFADIWERVLGKEGKSSGKKEKEEGWDGGFERKELGRFSPLNKKEEDEEREREREKGDKEREGRFGTMEWDYSRKNYEDEDDMESIEEDLGFEMEEKIAMRGNNEELGDKWKRKEFGKTGQDEKRGTGKMWSTNEEGEIKGNETQEKGKSVWEANERRSLSEFEIRWREQEKEQRRDGNSLVIQEDGSDEDKLEDSLEMLVTDYVKKMEGEEKEKEKENVKKKKNTKRASSQIEDQMQDMVSKVRPYSPPFGQTLSSDDYKEEGKWGMEGLRTMKSEDDEDEEKKGSKEEMELVYDPVLKCYYDPKTNTYFELK